MPTEEYTATIGVPLPGQIMPPVIRPIVPSPRPAHVDTLAAVGEDALPAIELPELTASGANNGHAVNAPQNGAVNGYAGQPYTFGLIGKRVLSASKRDPARGDYGATFNLPDSDVLYYMVPASKAQRDLYAAQQQQIQQELQILQDPAQTKATPEIYEQVRGLMARQMDAVRSICQHHIVAWRGPADQVPADWDDIDEAGYFDLFREVMQKSVMGAASSDFLVG